MKADPVLAGSAVPDADGALAALFEIAPDVPLIPPRGPVVGNADFRPALGIGLAVEADRLLRCVIWRT
jgi:hypothetical protein